jgi:hypothetical protein
MRKIFLFSMVFAVIALCATPNVEYDSAVAPIQIGHAGSNFEGEYFSLVNSGDAGTVTLTVVKDSGPADISVMYCDNQGMCYPGSHTFDVTAGGTISVHANIYSQVEGAVDYHFEMTYEGLTTPKQLAFRFLTDGLDVLVVDANTGSAAEAIYNADITAAGLTCGIWDRELAPLSDEAATAFDCFLWTTAASGLDEADRTAIAGLLTDGKKVFITGQGLASTLNDNGQTEFLHNTLHAGFVAQDSGIATLTGVTGDPITDGMAFSLSGDAHRGVISAFDAAATGILTYSENVFGAIRFTNGVYLDFAYENITPATARLALLRKSLVFFGFTVGNDDHSAGVTTPAMTIGNYPNPFNPSTTIRFSLPETGLAELSVYNLRGECVKTLVSANLTAGTHDVAWNGTDDNNRPLSTGVYFYRLKSGSLTATGKTILLK